MSKGKTFEFDFYTNKIFFILSGKLEHHSSNYKIIC